MRLETDFTAPLASPWRLTEIGAGRVSQSSGALRLELPTCASGTYHDAQLSDYAGKSDFRWRPPLHMEVRAGVSRQSPVGSHQSPAVTPSQPFPASREGLSDDSTPPPCTRGGGWGVGLTESPLHGTAGFGFWNHPFVPGERGFRLPQAVWFFFSSLPSDMRLALDVPGPGWKAATIDAARWPFLMLLPTAPLGFLLMRFPALYRRLWPVAQRAIGVSEALLDINLLLAPHTYTLDWQLDGVTFGVDGTMVHHAPVRIPGPLGFIAWVDNQYAIVTPQGRFGFGLVDVPESQALVVEYVKIIGSATK